MSLSKEEREYFDWLAEQPQSPQGLLVRVKGETRVVPRPSLVEFRSRHAQRFPRLERRRKRLAELESEFVPTPMGRRSEWLKVTGRLLEMQERL